ncbi:hypothetical protein KDA_69090 [Dictyobacter alpinus]|uniref:CopC domain-containing protein n=1 Tax=Dictyobacter alpinus TaxID=2014873 RepID=A0A402BJA8_9CHLR|nr:copper resistance protein CopC [Dictyobacter alpinus]GCE31425.1 hypothetical protein KDA_69090 [Dictyobacter alpinus]
MRLHLSRIHLICASMLSLGLFLTLVGTSFAAPFHAKVTSSDPKANSTIKQAPTKITVTTAENMKPGAANSNLLVYGPSGELINDGDAKVDLNKPDQMSVNIKPEKDGVYVVRWTTVSAGDEDPDQGAFVFTVGTAAGETTAQAQPTAVSTSNTAPAKSTTDNSGAIWIPIVTGLIALIVGLGVGVGIGRGSKPAAATTTTETPKTPINQS